MTRHVKTFMTGVLILAPLAITIWLIVWIGTALGALGYRLMDTVGLVEQFQPEYRVWAGAIGVVVVLVGVFLTGLLGNIWFFKKFFALVDHLVSAVPGVKTIYESVRDLLKLFGGEKGSMGRVVLYKPTGGVKMLGIVTNEAPAGRPEGDDSVLVYLPLGYMIGGPIIYAAPDQLEPVDMSAETALKLAMTAFVSVKDDEDGEEKNKEASKGSLPSN
ncbi:MAG: DUF502 domain-containing protein [Phycisphaerae bacterium]|nr:DUF502 domain-containing protein [Phycisphaerae bacterium]